MPLVADPRVEATRRLLVDAASDVQPGWQVLVRSQPPARPLIEEVSREIARRGAYALSALALDSSAASPPGRTRRPRSCSATLADDRGPRDRERRLLHGRSIAPGEHARRLGHPGRADGPRCRRSRRHARSRSSATRSRGSAASSPTSALAQDAGMSLERFEDFLYGAVLVDWDALERRWRGSPSASTRAKRGADRRARAPTSPSASRGATGRSTRVGANMPGGEIFYSPVEDSAEGVISFSEYPACYFGHDVDGVAPPLRGRPDRRGLGRARTRTSCIVRLDIGRGRTRCWASSGSAATRASSGT